MHASDFEISQAPTSNLLRESTSVTDVNQLQFSKVGDIFGPTTYLGKRSCLYRAWHFDVPAAHLGRRELSVKFTIRYNIMNSILVMIVNGEAKYKCKAIFVDKMMKIPFKLYDQDFLFTINVLFPKMYYSFDLLFNGSKLNDLTHQVTTTNVLVTTSTTKPKTVMIPNLRTVSIGKKSVVIYQIYSDINQERVMVEKRYSDFVRLDNILRGLFLGSHLKDTLPSLPDKVYNPFLDQGSFAFLSTRKQGLEDYLNFLLANDKVLVID